MKTINLIKIYIVLILILSNVSVYSQVTIGSAERPNKGALLDIKSQQADPNNNVTATKGLLLPRVSLQQQGSMSPIVVGDSTDIHLKHAGLIVYNVTNNPEGYINGSSGAKSSEYVLVPCIYVWSGHVWDDLGCISSQSGETSSLTVNCNPNPSIINVEVGKEKTIIVELDATITGSNYQLAGNSNIGSSNGFTASIGAQTLNNGDKIKVTITGNAISEFTNEKLEFIIEGTTCEVYITATDSEATLTIDCNPTPSVINVEVGKDASFTILLDATITGTDFLLGTNGNVGSLNGIQAGIEVQTLNDGDKIEVSITGKATEEMTNEALTITILGQSCTLLVNAVYPAPELLITNCSIIEPDRMRTAFVGQEIELYTYVLEYTSETVGSMLPAYSETKNGVTVNYNKVKLLSSGEIRVHVTGTPLSANTTVFDVDFVDQTCSFTLDVVNLPIVPCITTSLIDYAGGTVLPVAGVTVSIPYTGGIPGSKMEGSPSTVTNNGLTYAIDSVTSVPAGGSGNITVTITGTVPASGQSILDLNLHVTNGSGLDNGARVDSTLKVGCSTLFVEGQQLEEILGDYPNLYMVTPTATSFSFPVKKAYMAWADNTYLSTNKDWAEADPATVDIEWSSIAGGYLDGTEATAITLTDQGEDGMINLKLKGNNIANGSFIVNYKKNGVIVWSWHIWVTPYTTAAEALSVGAVMNQNLGATSGLTTTGGQSDRGFFYQWGRKDPLAGANVRGSAVSNQSAFSNATATERSNQVRVYAGISNDYYDNTDNVNANFRYGMKGVAIAAVDGIVLKRVINEPFVFYGSGVGGNESDWYSYTNTEFDNKLWGGTDGTDKGIFDPCPLGWRVPRHEELNNGGMLSTISGMPSANNAMNSGLSTSWGYALHFDESSKIASAGYARPDNGTYQMLGYTTFIWTTTKGATGNHSSFAVGFTLNNTNIPSGSDTAGNSVTTGSVGIGRSFGASVRCVKHK